MAGSLYGNLQQVGQSAHHKRRKKRAKHFIKGAIQRPGALTAREGGNVTAAKSQQLAQSGSPLAKKQASFYLNVLAPANRRRQGA